MSIVDDVSDWFLGHRGINRETLKAFGVSVEADGTVNLPYPNGSKARPNPIVPLPPEKRRFYFTAGRVPELFQPTVQPVATSAFLCEGETDTLRVYQETEGKHPVFGLGGINTWNEVAANRLSAFDQVYVILDNDTDYMVKGQVDAVWRKIRNDLGGKAKRITLPADVKDACEFFDRYDTDTLKLLCQRMGQSRFKPIDFNIPPPPVRWLLDGYVAMGDVTLLVGLGGLGKSFVTSGLAISILTGADTFLGQQVREEGNVLYVDEENPLDVVYDRMKKLGLDPAQHSGKLRYLWNLGLRLDRDPDTLLDEALEFKPKLIVLDSLTRLHSKAEDKAGEISPLFNDAIKPLARETGAGVILIHHHDKGANSARGSSDIYNSVDAEISIYKHSESNPDTFRMKMTKSRRRSGKESEKVVSIIDNPDGSIALQVDPPISYQF